MSGNDPGFDLGGEKMFQTLPQDCEYIPQPYRLVWLELGHGDMVLDCHAGSLRLHQGFSSLCPV